ncbi:MAG: hypothetical protein A3F54_02645 [Candidatus Kerfeldbacteria bacterium RIFCSPHIGHO2_12_FULL_48_17]|uniref:Uncharacterized protein n=1 Tax=Candidatus Kerfeldbacteria bacterium RIFCSPHIGHO2_12_FULL_48_17 TaxID=1798542 RepID=A0A1G2AX75_9BACT|nr:MAG: hypothetical protein A3F54_02645 [Candidatus Kerfeldbacteria bacterium RIFCSPHIGHO2_12_FULL_48_17]
MVSSSLFFKFVFIYSFFFPCVSYGFVQRATASLLVKLSLALRREEEPFFLLPTIQSPPYERVAATELLAEVQGEIVE